MCETCNKTQEIIQNWVNQQSHDRCWYYPDLFQKLVKLHSIKPNINPQLPPREEFERGCKKYQEEEYNDSRKGR